MSFRSVFRHRPFAVMWTGRVFSQIAALTQSVAIGWSVYTIARQSHDEQHSMFLVGMVGLAQFVPMFFLSLLAGTVADKYDRRKILAACYGGMMVCAALYTFVIAQPHPSLVLIFLVATLFGLGRTFGAPAATSMVPALVPRDVLPRAIAWNTLAVQTGMVIGPWLGGILCGISPVVANATACAMYGVATTAVLMLLRFPINAKAVQTGASRVTMIREGLLHLWSSKIILGAISLDLFAVLLGGVTSLLPAYAKDVLFIGPEGFGHLRSALALGGGLTTLTLAMYPLKRHAGKWMLGGVTLYGIATLCFAYSENFWLSMGALMIAGIGDSLSVFVRQNLVQIVTPDTMRGRVSAVSGLFISASNELGEFESGVAARFLGVVGAAVFGGVGSVIVTGLWAKMFPALREADRLEAPKL